MKYRKCRDCKYRCRCCASHFFDESPKYSGCENRYDEFYPAKHITRCPLDGEKIKHPLVDVNGNVVREE